MATLMVRDIDDEQYGRLVETARANKRSVAAEVRAIIEERDRAQRRRETVEDFLEFTRRHAIKLPKGKTSLDLLRQERANW